MSCVYLYLWPSEGWDCVDVSLVHRSQSRLRAEVNVGRGLGGESGEGGAVYLLLLSSAGLIPKMSSSFLPLFFSGFRLRKFSRFLCK